MYDNLTKKIETKQADNLLSIRKSELKPVEKIIIIRKEKQKEILFKDRVI